MIHLSSNWNEIDVEIDRIANMPSLKAQALLNNVLTDAFAFAQGQVHVITGSLKGSGKQESEVDKFEQNWEGTLSWGGPTTGPKNPVDYAIYEKRRLPDENKGIHDWLEGIDIFHPMWVLAVKGALTP